MRKDVKNEGEVAEIIWYIQFPEKKYEEPID